MWVFAYGSLMWDGWEAAYGCTDRTIATIAGYRRVLNEASTVNWGSLASPAPTLNLVAETGRSCTGMACDIPAGSVGPAMVYLERREGRDFLFENLGATLMDGRTVTVTAARYTGRNIVRVSDEDELVAKIMAAGGQDGSGAQYVRNLVAKLDAMGVEDADLDRIVGKLAAQG